MADSKLSALSEISVPALEDLLYWVDDPSGTPVSVKCSATRAFGLLNHVCQGRLTLTSGTPVTTSDVTGATNIYFTPCNGQCVALYDGTRWRMYTFTEKTLALGTLTSGLPYDVFLYDNAGTLTLEALAWTNGTTRATALVQQDGVWCKTGALTRRYLGTFYTTSTTTTEDSAAKRFVWNMYNQAERKLKITDTANSWTYTTNSYRSWDNSTANRVEFILGLSEKPVNLTFNEFHTHSAGSLAAGCGIGLDSTSANSADVFAPAGSSSTTTQPFWSQAKYLGFPAVGYHYLQLLEIAATSGTTTFYGDNGLTWQQAGAVGSILG